MNQHESDDNDKNLHFSDSNKMNQSEKNKSNTQHSNNEREKEIDTTDVDKDETTNSRQSNNEGEREMDTSYVDKDNDNQKIVEYINNEKEDIQQIEKEKFDNEEDEEEDIQSSKANEDKEKEISNVQNKEMEIRNNNIDNEENVVPTDCQNKNKTQHHINQQQSSDSDYSSDDDSDESILSSQIYLGDDAIVLPRDKNRRHNTKKYFLTHLQKKYYSDIMCESNRIEFFKCESIASKKAFLYSLYLTHFFNKRVFIYNEAEFKYELIDTESLLQKMQKRFNNMKGNKVFQSKDSKESKKKGNDGTLSSKRNTSVLNRGIISPKDNHLFDEVYKNANQAYDYQNWNYYSMIHGLF